MWLDGELVIQRTPPADMHTLVRTVRLDAGVHEIRVEYEQHGGALTMRLEWAPPGGRARPLPAYRLFREWPDTDDVRLAHGVAWLQRAVATLWIAMINDNYFCRLPRTGLAGSWVMAAACETARFPLRRTGWSRMHRFGDCARNGCPERHWRQRRRRPG